MTDQRDMTYMEMALQLAAQARGRTSPNPLVGAVIVKGGQVVGKGYHRFAGGSHAEVEALNEAGDEAYDATLYVTLEPCNHYGRTPPCTEKIISSQINRVVVAHEDPNPLVGGKGIARLREAGIIVDVGLLQGKAKKLNEKFIKYISTGMPFVAVKGAISIDGKTATRTGHSQWITGKEARLKVHQLRDEYDGILVGIGTVLADDPQLTTRLPGSNSRDPVRIILDSEARIPLDAKLLVQDSISPTIVVVTNKASKEKVQCIEDQGTKVLVVADEQGQINLQKLLQQLAKMNITSVLVEGGARVNGSFFNQRLVDKVYMFMAPKIMGGNGSLGFIEGWGVEKVSQAIPLKNLTVQMFGNDFGYTGYPDYEGGDA